MSHQDSKADWTLITRINNTFRIVYFSTLYFSFPYTITLSYFAKCKIKNRLEPVLRRIIIKLTKTRVFFGFKYK